VLPHSTFMDTPTFTVMRASLWLLFAGSTAISLSWMCLLLASGFEVWSDSNSAGLSLQAVLLLYPVGLFVALRKSSASLNGTVATFVGGWIVAVAALMFFDML
jgi:uncharacterized membrane protein YGL010W